MICLILFSCVILATKFTKSEYEVVFTRDSIQSVIAVDPADIWNEFDLCFVVNTLLMVDKQKEIRNLYEGGKNDK